MGYTYHGVTIGNCQTLQFEMTQERDPSGADAVWSKYTIRVRGFLTEVEGQDPDAIALSNDTSAVLARVKDLLTTPRRAFTYTVGGTTLVDVPLVVPLPLAPGEVIPTGLAMDAKYGPEPLPTTVHQVTSGCYMVETGVVVRQVKCSSACNEFSSPVVSLRWSQTESFDENWYSRLVTNGKLIVRTDFFQSADSFRKLTVPTLLPDYVRVNSQYTLSPDGTHLDFTFEDVERDRLPPAPATKASGSMTVTVKSGAVRTGTVRVHLEGPKGTSRKLLMIRAIEICYSKMNPEFSNVAGQNIANPVYSGSFSEDLFNPVVDVEMSALLSNVVPNGVYKRPDGSVFSTTSPIAFPSVGTVPTGCGPSRAGVKPADRKRIRGLLAAAFSDPCCL